MAQVAEDEKNSTHICLGRPATRWLGIALIFTVFFIVGGAPPSHNNESHYLCKAKHYWQADWCAGDMFLESADAHLAFYWTIGWLTRWFSLPAVAWIGRGLAWGLLAWVWQRLARTVVSRPLYGVLAAAMFLALVGEAHFAGEWIVGGVEAKCFAYSFVLLGLEAMAKAHWRRCWPLFGLASAFHPVVGGWAVVAAAAVWLFEPAGRRPRLTSMLPAIVFGGLLALPGLLPALSLTHGQPGEVVNEARQIYVFDRLPHHLAPLSQPRRWIITRSTRHGLMLLGFFLLCRYVRKAAAADAFLKSDAEAIRRGESSEHLSRITRFAWATLGISLSGLLAELVLWNNPSIAACLLRFYWFRLADIAIPLATSLAVIHAIARLMRLKSRWAAPVLLLAMLGPGWFLLSTSNDHLRNPSPLGEKQLTDHASWQQACHWAREHTPSDSLFLVPRFGQTFIWHAHRADVVNWKDIPQDAAGIVDWQNRYANIYYDNRDGEHKPFRSLASQGTSRLRKLAQKYNASHVITLNDPPLQLPVVYANETYAIYATAESRKPPSRRLVVEKSAEGQ